MSEACEAANKIIIEQNARIRELEAANARLAEHGRCLEGQLAANDARIRELEARCAAMVGALEFAHGYADWPERQPGDGAFYWRRHMLDPRRDSDLAPWVRLVEAVSLLLALWPRRAWSETAVVVALGRLIDAARECGMGEL